MKKLILIGIVISLIGCKKEAPYVKYRCHCEVNAKEPYNGGFKNPLYDTWTDYETQTKQEAQNDCDGDKARFNEILSNPTYKDQVYTVDCHL